MITIISETEIFSPMFNKNYSSSGLIRLGIGIAVLIWNKLGLEVQTSFLDPAGELVRLDVSDKKGRGFRLVAVYAPTRAG